jgi:hypothetical protein
MGRQYQEELLVTAVGGETFKRPEPDAGCRATEEEEKILDFTILKSIKMRSIVPPQSTESLRYENM